MDKWSDLGVTACVGRSATHQVGLDKVLEDAPPTADRIADHGWLLDQVTLVLLFSNRYRTLTAAVRSCRVPSFVGTQWVTDSPRAGMGSVAVEFYCFTIHSAS